MPLGNVYVKSGTVSNTSFSSSAVSTTTGLVDVNWSATFYTKYSGSNLTLAQCEGMLVTAIKNPGLAELLQQAYTYYVMVRESD